MAVKFEPSALRPQGHLQLLKQSPVRGIVAKPFLAAAEHSSSRARHRGHLADASNCDAVSLWVFRVAFEQIIGPYCDRDLFALIDFDYRQSFDLHHSNTPPSYALHAADIGGVRV